MNMTPEEAQDFFHQARSKAMREASDYSKPVVQKECELKAFEALIKEITKRVDVEWSFKLLGDVHVAGGTESASSQDSEPVER